VSLKLLRAADRAAMPWKNGGGITRDVALSGVGPDDFTWRVSLAEIERPGPFSRYPGIDRQFVPVHGKVQLTIEDRPVTVGPADDPCAFPGEAAVFGYPLTGTVEALNVMTRRGGAQAALRRVSGGEATPVTGTLLVLALGAARIRCDREGWRSLARLDAALIEPPCALAIDGDAWLISISP
jgi:environmental stress-induced protein Ves